MGNKRWVNIKMLVVLFIIAITCIFTGIANADDMKTWIVKVNDLFENGTMEFRAKTGVSGLIVGIDNDYWTSKGEQYKRNLIATTHFIVKTIQPNIEKIYIYKLNGSFSNPFNMLAAYDGKEMKIY